MWEQMGDWLGPGNLVVYTQSDIHRGPVEENEKYLKLEQTKNSHTTNQLLYTYYQLQNCWVWKSCYNTVHWFSEYRKQAYWDWGAHKA